MSPMCSHCQQRDKEFAHLKDANTGAWQYRNKYGHWVDCPTQEKLVKLPQPRAVTPHCMVCGRTRGEDSFIHWPSKVKKGEHGCHEYVPCACLPAVTQPRESLYELAERLVLIGDSDVMTSAGKKLAIVEELNRLVLSVESSEMLGRIRASLIARADGRDMGGDIVVMEAVDRIVKRESQPVLPLHRVMCGLCISDRGLTQGQRVHSWRECPECGRSDQRYYTVVEQAQEK